MCVTWFGGGHRVKQCLTKSASFIAQGQMIRMRYMAFLSYPAMATWTRFARIAQGMGNGIARLIWPASDPNAPYAQLAMAVAG
jgi:hypothetical protein